MKKKIYLILFGFLIFSLSFTNLYAKTLKIVFGTKQECDAFCSSTCKFIDGGMEADGYMCQKDVLDSDKSKYPTKYSVSDTSVEVKKGAAVEITLTFEFEKEITEGKKYDGKCFSVDNNIKIQKSSSTGNEISYKITGNTATPTGKNAEVKCIYAGQTNYLSKAISVKVTPAQTYNNMSDCNDCRDKCIVDGVFSVKKKDTSGAGINNKCVQITVDNLYVLYNNKESKALKGDFLCGTTNNIDNVKYTCDDQYNLEDTEIDTSINFKPGSISCEELLDGNPILFVKLFIIIIRVLSPILLIALSAADFMKAISQQEEDAALKAWKRFGTRCIIVTIIMLLPTILNILSRLFDVFDSCGIW